MGAPLADIIVVPVDGTNIHLTFVPALDPAKYSVLVKSETSLSVLLKGSATYKARARRERRWARASRGAALLAAVPATYAVVHVLAARRRRRERVAATEFKAKVAPYLVEAPEL